MSRGPYWTPEEDAILADCIERGMSYRQISRVIGRPPNGVEARGRRVRRGVDHPPPPPPPPPPRPPGWLMTEAAVTEAHLRAGPYQDAIVQAPRGPLLSGSSPYAGGGGSAAQMCVEGA